MFKRKVNKKISSSILITSLLVIFLVFTLTASATYRPAVIGVNGLVTSANPLVSQAGLQILMKGGNAIDAAVAVAATLNVIEGSHSGMGGNGFATIYWAPDNKILSLGLTGAAPYAVDPETLTQADLSSGYKAGLVPGALGGWLAALQRFGTMSLKEVMEIAINYAEYGFPIDSRLSSYIERTKSTFELFPSSARVFLPNGRAPQVGEIFVLKDLANTFKKLVAAEQTALKQGKSREEAIQAAFDRFYTGDIAQEFVRFYQENDGLFTAKDFADFKPIWKEPLHTNYRGYDVYSSPSTSRSGYEVLMQANLIEGFDLQELGHNSAEYLHLVFECIKLAKSDIYHYVADEEFVDIPTEGMLSKEYAALRRQLIDPDKAMAYPSAGNPKDFQIKGLVPVYSTVSRYIDAEYEDSIETTNFDIVDSYGNAVSSTMTLGGIWGTKVVVGNTGIQFNNGSRWGSVSPYKDDANNLEGGKIPLLGNGPTIVLKDGKVFMIYGTPGGEGVGQTTFQALLNVVDFGMGIQEAIEAPRGRIYANPDFYNPEAKILVRMESRILEEVVKELETKGHEIKMYGEFTSSAGGMQAILVDQEYGTWTGAGDPRRGGYAVGY